MTRRPKKMASIAGIISTLLFSMLSAADYTQSGPENINCPQECPPALCPPKPCAPCEPDPCCPRTPAYGYDVPCNFAILHDAGPRICNGFNLFVTVDFLWWTAREEGLAYATSGVSTFAVPSSGSLAPGSAVEGEWKHPDFDWDPGFKIGAGINLWHDGWDLYAQYTWFHADGNRTTSTGIRDQETADALFPTWQVGSFIGTASRLGFPSPFIDPVGTILSKATGRWDLHFNAVDVEVGRNYFVSRCLTLRPFFGFKGTWQHQDYKVRYFTSTFTKNEERIDMFRMRQDHDMWGLGIRCGVNTAWHFTRGWSIFGNWALTALHTKYDIDRRDRYEQERVSSTDGFLDGFGYTAYKANNTFYTLKGVLELMMGLRWDIWLGCNDNFHFRLQAAWEEQLWWSQNNMIGRSEESAHGDLMLHGLNIKARLDF